jgi:hypothetical protein
MEPIASFLNQAHQLTATAINLRNAIRAVIVLIACAFAHHLLLVKKHPNAPPLIKSIFPFIGVGLNFLNDPEKFLRKCTERYGGIYTLYMGGKRLHVVNDPVDGIPTIFKSNKVYDRFFSTRTHATALFGVTQEQIEDSQLQKESFELFHPYLMATEAVNTLMEVFTSNLKTTMSREIQKLNGEGQLDKGVVVDLDVWVRKVLVEVTGRTLFGETWPSDDDFFNDLCTWDRDIYSVLKGYPSIFTRNATAAREWYYSRLLKMFEEGLVNPSKLIDERLKVSLFKTSNSRWNFDWDIPLMLSRET